MFTVGFYIPLKQIMGASSLGMSSYAQYLMPLIALTGNRLSPPSVGCVPISDRLGSGHQPAIQGHADRVRLPRSASRMSASMYRCSIALAVSLVCGHVIGFRFYGGWAHTVGFCLLVLLIGARRCPCWET